MRNDIPEHQDIARTLATGYPIADTDTVCSGCGKIIPFQKDRFSVDGEAFCEACTRKIILDNHTTAELAEMVGLTRISSEEERK